MSMPLALEFGVEWLRDRYGFKENECGVQHDALPPLNAGSFYIALDDGGVEPGNEQTDSLKEILTLVIGIWRRPEHLQKSQRGLLKLPQDKYLMGSFTLWELERKVLIHKTVNGITVEGKHGFHNNWRFVIALNERYNLPHADLGAEFRYPLRYRGRGRMETVAIDGGADVQAWYGYRMRFRGLEREQKQRSVDDAIG